MESCYQNPGFLFLYYLGSLTHLGWNSGSKLSHCFCSSSPRWLFHAVSFFPSWALLEQDYAHRTESNAKGLRSPRAEGKALHGRLCDVNPAGTNDLCLREGAWDKVCERLSPSARLAFQPALAEEQTTEKRVVIFTAALALARRKVEEGLKESASGAALACFTFSPCLVLTQHGIAWERWRENAFQKRKGAPI